jgi:TonB-linked SusC/RagA family outer membrane protein
MNLAGYARSIPRALIVVSLCAAPAIVSAQGTITGRVTASGSNAPVAAARVIAVGTNSSATTGSDGNFTLRHVPLGANVVQVLRVGFETQKKPVTLAGAENGTVNFELASSTVVKLAEVVTTATGEQRAVELGNTTTSLNDIGARMENSATYLSVGDLLVQKAPSVNVLGQGSVGAGAAIRIRGLNSVSLTNEPIVLVDGIRVATDALNPGNGVGGTQTGLLNSFTPEEIESIEIIKGPSASTMYGTNSANGVILISTKRGHIGGARWTWMTEQGKIKDNNDYPSSYAIWGHAPNATAQIRCLLPTMSATTCIQDSVTSLNILKNSSLSPLATGSRALYGMQVAGGIEQVRYFISGNIENALGPVAMPDFAQQRLDSMHLKVRGEWAHPEALQRENFRANMNATVTPNLDLGVTTAFVKSDQRFPQSDASPVGMFAAARSSPGFAHPGLGYSNIGALGENLHGYNGWIPSEIFQDLNTEGVQRETLAGNAVARPRSWMEVTATTGIDYTTFTDFGVCRLNECPAQGTLRNGVSYSRTTNERILSAKLSSISTWNARPDLNVKTSVGSEYTYISNDFSNSLGLNLTPGAQNVGQASARTNSLELPQTVGKNWGVFLQEQAAFRDRFFITAGLRADQNSAFGSEYTWAKYPRASLSWLMSDESFFPRFSWLDQFRARIAYGQSGTQPALTSSFQTFRPITASINGTDTQGLIGDQAGNPQLKPERTSETELGFDARVWQNRANVQLTYFTRKTNDGIVAMPIAPSSTSSSLFQYANAGTVDNSGIEAVVTAQLADRRSIAWDLTVSASHGTSKLKSLGPQSPIVIGNTRQVPGYPVSSLFFRSFSYNDANSDGRIQQSEVTVDTAFRSYGYQVPRDLLSIQNGFDLLARRLRVTALLDYKGGHSVFDASSAYLCQQFLSCPDESNPSATLADQARSVANRYGTVVNGTTYTTAAGYVSNGRFWRLREVAATLTLPNTIGRKILRGDHASVTLGARNLHVWSNYSGVDPESNYGMGDLQNDFMTAAPPTYYTLRLNLHY